MVGLYQELSPKWAVMCDVGWQDWSQFGQVEVEVDTARVGSPAGTVQLHYQDTWHGAVGLQYRYSDQWRFSSGVAFDSSAVDSEHRSVMLPMGQAWRFGLGAEWQASKKLSLGAAYMFIWSGDMSVNQGTDLDPGGQPSARGRVAGSYNDVWLSFFTLNLVYRF
jgi:long-chain fatty acid transport protein